MSAKDIKTFRTYRNLMKQKSLTGAKMHTLDQRKQGYDNVQQYKHLLIRTSG